MNGMILYPTDDDIVALQICMRRCKLYETLDSVGIKNVSPKSGFETKLLISKSKLPPLLINETVLG